ncbi:MAG: long-chain-fatty-acid--CoA ligase [Bdellovibrionales bacterium CG10_big_fil_rev_8_21_14_0_10_45_34]|nr:MAG: long-chain-fatty-acid--CoA ligase [Bdellovibrionales bacterium CG10_big_fil_rev_8_21_14_0_10_45_34]
MEKIWLKNYPKNVAPEININEFQSINDVFSEACKKYGRRGAYSNMGKTISYNDLDDLTNHLAAYFQNQLGLKKGDRVAIQLPNILQFPITLFAAQKAGLVVVNTNPLYTVREMEHQFVDAGVKCVVILANFAHNLEKVLPKTKIESVIVTELGDMLPQPKRTLVNFVVKYVKKMVPNFSLGSSTTFLEAIEKGKGQRLEPVDVRHDDYAFLQYTGGTTGVAKGAALTQKNILANMLQISAWMAPKLKEGQEIAMAPLPLYHVFSLTVNCLSFMKYGALNVLITNPRDIAAFIKELKKWKFSVFVGLNTLFNALLNHPKIKEVDFSSLQIGVAGGMALQGAVLKRWEDHTKSKLVEGYGLTEASPVVCCNPIDGSDRPGTIGLPLPSTEVRICDDAGKELGIGEVGELWAKGPQVMKGYWNRQDETDNVLNSDGWLRTGDMATVDSDGFFKIVDRKKDMIIVSGFKVFPNEVEEVIAMNSKVLEVAVIGVDDERSGESVKAVIVKKQPSLTESEVIAFCQERLTNYKVPKHIEFRHELPKTNVGKILRRALRE